jgi:hypothetical protein
VRILEAGDWSLLLPAEWSAERDGDVILVGDSDGVGCLEISALEKAAGDDAAAPDSFLDPALDWSPVTCGSFKGSCARFEEDGAALREWVITCGDLLLYLTYSCDLDNRGMDDAAVDELLDTLRYAPEDKDAPAS